MKKATVSKKKRKFSKAAKKEVTKEFRKTAAFLNAYREVFGTEVEIKSVPPEVQSLLSQAVTSGSRDDGTPIG